MEIGRPATSAWPKLFANSVCRAMELEWLHMPHENSLSLSLSPLSIPWTNLWVHSGSGGAHVSADIPRKQRHIQCPSQPPASATGWVLSLKLALRMRSAIPSQSFLLRGAMVPASDSVRRQQSERRHFQAQKPGKWSNASLRAPCAARRWFQALLETDNSLEHLSHQAMLWTAPRVAALIS